jgi:hypothetical protein
MFAFLFITGVEILRLCWGGLNYFVGFEARNLNNRQICHRKSCPEGSSQKKQILGLMVYRCGNALFRMARVSFILTSRKAYIQCKGCELRSNPANRQKGTRVNVGLNISND